MKRIAFLVTLAFVFVGTALWVSQNFVARWEPQLRSRLEERLESALGARVHIGDISIFFIHQATLRDIEIWDTHTTPETLLFRARQVTLTANLIDLPHAVYHRNPTELIGSIRIEDPLMSISPQWLNRRRAHQRPSRGTPLWFTVEWTRGTFQWIGASLPRSSTTFYHSKGSVRIRGPHMEISAEGALDHVEDVKVSVSTLGKRWNARTQLHRGDIAGVVDTLERIFKRPLLPKSWKTHGRFDLSAKAGGRLPMASSMDPGQLIKEARLSFSDTRIDPGQNKPPLQIKGGVVLRGARLDFSGLSVKTDTHVIKTSGHLLPFTKPVQFDLQATSSQVDLALLSRYLLTSSSSTPLLQGTGSLELTVKGEAPRPPVTLRLKIPQGHLWRWPFEDAQLDIRRSPEGWDILPSTLHLLEGSLLLKGALTQDQLDIQMTGKEMSLRALSTHLDQNPVKGRLNFSLSTSGSLDTSPGNSSGLRTTGSFWISGFNWVQSYAESLRGDIDLTPAHFKLQGASDNGDIRLKIEGVHTDQAWVLHQAMAQFRPDATLTLRGTYRPHQRSLQGTVEGRELSLSEDVPALHAKFPSLQGHVNVHGDFEGTLPNPVLKARLESQDFQMAMSSPSAITATIQWTPEELNVDAQAAFKHFPVSEGSLRFSLQKRSLVVQRLSLLTSRGKADFKGRGIWEALPPGITIPKDILLSGTGEMISADEGVLWRMPFRLKGRLHPMDKWRGEVNLHAPAFLVHGEKTDPFETHVQWDAMEIKWDASRWGPLTSNGILQWKDPRQTLSGQLQAQNADLASLQALFLPHRNEPVRGLLNGTFALNGSLKDPQLQFSGKVTQGSWRAFRFDSNIEGLWKNDRLEPFVIEGRFLTGGQFHFRGRVSPSDQTASGSLDLMEVNLKPIGESLSFPHPLEGLANGTFTVGGPLHQLRFAGHMEAKSLVYGEPNPLRVQSYVMDLKLEPTADNAETTRLTISNAIARTLEEEIRINPGSFVEFMTARRQGRMRIGTEIRNLHLGVFTLFGTLDLNGTWDIRPLGFALQGDIFTRSLFINDYQLEQGHVQASYYNRLLSFQPSPEKTSLVTGRIDFQKAPQLTFKDFALTGRERENFQLSGDIGPSLWNFTMLGEGLDIGMLGGLAGFPYPLEGTANLKIRGSGDLEHPDVQGDVQIENGSVLGLNFEDGKATFAWQGQRMTFTRLQLRDPGRYTLTGTGVFPLANAKKKNPDKNIDFSLRLENSNLGLLRSISREVRRAEGAVQALIQIKGTSENPNVQGSIRVKNGDVDGAHYFRHLRDLQLAIDFDGNELVVNELRARSGKGEFVGGGRILFSGLEPKYYDLHLDIPSVKGVEVTIPELAIPESPLAKKLRFLLSASQCDVRGRVTFKGPAENPVFMGKAFLSNGHFTFPPPSRHPPPAAFLEWVRRILWDVDLRFSDGAWFENELVEANLIGGLAIKGPSDRLKVDGSIDITEGRISYLGVEFDIRQARFDLRTTEAGSALVTTPYVRGIAESHVQTVDAATGQPLDDTVTLTINYAAVNEIKPQLRSSTDPGLAQDKLLARVSQLELEKLTPQERTYLYQQQMVRLIDTSLTTPLARSLLKRTGLVDEFHVSRVINPTASTLTADPNNPAGAQQDAFVNLLAGTKYTVAKRLSNRVSLGYGLRFEEIQTSNIDNRLVNKLDLRSDVELSYRFLSNLYLRGTFDLPTTTPGVLPDRRVTIEPRWRFGWWGHTNKPKPKPATPPPSPPSPVAP